MKVLLLAALVAVAVAAPRNGLVTPGAAGPEPIIMPTFPSPVAVGPAIIDSFEPIAIGPAIVDSFEPISVGPAWVDTPVPQAAGPLVQLIVNVKPAATVPAPVVVPQPSPVVEPQPAPTPVQVDVAPTPVQVVEAAPVPIEPVVIGTPVIPSPAVVLPDDLN